MDQFLKTIEKVLIPFGVALGIANVEEVLGVVLLILQLGLIIWNIIFTIYKKIKQGKVDDVDDVLQQGIEDIKQLTEEDDEK